ncbi:MAG: phosphoribosylanthranilate isomerase [Pirellulales bacterium]
MFTIKICGVTSVADAIGAAEAGADAVGLNFYPGSVRFVDTEQARQIVGALPDSVAKVGVFVDAPVEQILATVRQVALDWVQLHGDEPAESLAHLGEVKLIKAFRLAAADIAPIVRYLADCRRDSRLPDAVLVDAYRPGQYGGTGQRAPWEALAPPRDGLSDLPLILAGGLTPENIQQAIGQVSPAAVDTASGVEQSPGQKSPQRMREFVRNARDAIAATPH